LLFNSYTFIFIFLPLVLSGFFYLGSRVHPHAATAWLVGMSLAFYGWWNPAYLGLLLFSILFNYGMGTILSGKKSRKIYLSFGIFINLGLLGYFKYANFFVQVFNTAAGSSFNLGHVLLPLAISFFTFQQIAYLVDAHRKQAKEYNFLHYCLFVTFFPQLIAGPIVHHREMMPQFGKLKAFHFNAAHLEVGLTMFSFGLFKKVILADGIAEYANPVFSAASAHTALTALDAWTGASAYAFQLYFDFSAYSDMALGLAIMFGIYLPINFNSPYTAVNIIDFWKRWHITLSRFLRDYLYIPLGGNRKGTNRRYANVMITMLLGGLWHGAGWTFVLWGGLHGVYLVINHLWHAMRRLLGHDPDRSTRTGRFFSTLLTFLAVVVAWVLFRAENMDAANYMLIRMFSLHGGWFESHLFAGDGLFIFLCFVFLSVVTWIFPNLQEWMGYRQEQKTTDRQGVSKLRGLMMFRPTRIWAMLVALLMVTAVLRLTHISEFIYFRF